MYRSREAVPILEIICVKSADNPETEKVYIPYDSVKYTLESYLLAINYDVESPTSITLDFSKYASESIENVLLDNAIKTLADIEFAEFVMINAGDCFIEDLTPAIKYIFKQSSIMWTYKDVDVETLMTDETFGVITNVPMNDLIHNVVDNNFMDDEHILAFAWFLGSCEIFLTVGNLRHAFSACPSIKQKLIEKFPIISHIN